MSWQAKFLRAFLRATALPMLAKAQDPIAMRARADRMSARAQVLPPLTLVQSGEVGGVAGKWVSNRPSDGRVILYFHGGAYIMGSSATHSGVAAGLARRTGARVFVADYRLAPEYPFPAAFDDAVAAYEGLLTLGHAPSQIVIGGDSAGGGLALALLAHLCRAGSVPAGVFAFSPWTDLTLSGASLVTNASREQMLPAHRMTEFRTTVMGGARPADADDPRLSPLHASYPGAPPVQIHVAETEILRDDALRMRSRLPDAEIRMAGDLPHVWPLFAPYLPEGRATLDQTAAFIRSCLQVSDEN